MGNRLFRPDRLLLRRRPVRRALSLFSAAFLAFGIIAMGAAASSGALRGALLPHKAPSPGKWTPLDPALWPWAAPAVTVLMGPGDTASALWERQVSSSNYTYEVAKIGPDGSIVQQPTSIFGSDTWGSLSPFPTLLPYGKEMVVVFDGTRGTTGPYSQGCIVVATSAKPTWVLEPWSLSQDCVGNNGGATVTRNGTLSAAWISGNQIDYRVGVSQTIPPGTPDSYFSVPGHGSPDSANVVTDLAGSDDVYAAWNQNDSSPATDNGFWVKDLMGGSAMKAPGSGLNSVSNFPEFSELVPLANTNTHGGVFVVYCSNASTCSLLLWRIGAKKPLVVPGSANALDAAISAGPDGRIWVAWANRSSNDVSTVRTNTADTAFGPVETYATPCGGGPTLGLTGGDYGRLDIAMTCINTADKYGIYVTQSLAGLSLSPSRLEISARSSNKIDFGVFDAGDPVAGATVKVDGKSATTNAKGDAFFTFPKGSNTGHFTVTASAPNYYPAHAILDIVS